MAKITYHIVEHDGGWAYQVNGVFSETFPSHDLAQGGGAARGSGAARAGRNPSHLVGRRRRQWHEELARGDDRPETDVEG